MHWPHDKESPTYVIDSQKAFETIKLSELIMMSNAFKLFVCFVFSSSFSTCSFHNFNRNEIEPRDIKI